MGNEVLTSLILIPALQELLIKLQGLTLNCPQGLSRYCKGVSWGCLVERSEVMGSIRKQGKVQKSS